MAITTNAFENYKNTIESSAKGNFLSKLQSFGLDSLGGLDSFMGKDIIKANKLLKAFQGFDLNSILSNLGGFFQNLGQTALKMLKDMGMDALRQLENASINFVSNLAEDLYNNVRSMMYIPDTAFAVTLKGLYAAGADLAYNDHYIRKSALQRDWAVSLEFIDEQYGIDYNLRDYIDLESDLSTCAKNSCVNNMYYIFDKMYKQLKTLRAQKLEDETYFKPYTEPILSFKELTLEEAKATTTDLYIDVGSEKMQITEGYESEFVRDHPEYKYYIQIVTDYAGIANGLDPNHNYTSEAENINVTSRYAAYLDNIELINRVESFMVLYFKSLIVHGYTYLTATSVQKFFSDFSTVLSPKYYGVTDDKYNRIYNFTQSDCLIMMPSYNGNDITKTDQYTRELAQQQSDDYIAAEGMKSESSKAAAEADAINNAAKRASGATNSPWSESGYTANSAVAAGTAKASAKLKEFRAKSMEKISTSQNVSYTANIRNGIANSLDMNSNGLLNRSNSGINAKKDNKKLQSMYDREIVKKYEMAGAIADELDKIDLLNKDTKYIVLRNKNIKQIYALLNNSTLYGANRMVNDYFYKRCRIKTMDTLNQSLSKAASIIGSTYAIQALFDMESAVDSSAYVYIKKVENYLLNPKEHSYHGMDTMFSSGENMWTQFGDYFKQAYNWDDSIEKDSELEEMIEKLANTKESDLNNSKETIADIDPETDLSSKNGANPETFSEIITDLKENYTASTYVDNVIRFMSDIPALELRDILNRYLTLFYKGMAARDIDPKTNFERLIKSMSGISNITDYSMLNSNVFSKSTHKALLANAKFLISLYALKNSHNYLLADLNDPNKDEIVKLYNLVFSLGCADIQMSGTISIISKYDKGQLNSLVKHNFFSAIKHLKSINDKNKPLIVTAPKYKDSLTKTFDDNFDIRGIFGYNLFNNKIVYDIPDHTTGDWNSIGVSGDAVNGVFFCKSNINNDGSAIYRRMQDGESISKVNINTSIENINKYDFYAISFKDYDANYFGLVKPISGKNSLFVYDSTSEKIVEVSGFTENPNNFEFKIDSSHNLLIITSKNNKGCYYSKVGDTVCKQLTTKGSNHFFITLSDGTLAVCPKDSISEIGYFDKDGNYINTCELPSGANTVTNAISSESTVNLMITVPLSTVGGSTQQGAPATVTIPKQFKIPGILLSTNVGIVNLLAISGIDSTTGEIVGKPTLKTMRTYDFSGSYYSIYDDLTVLGISSENKIISRKLKSIVNNDSYTSMNSITSSLKLYQFESVNEAIDPSNIGIKTINNNYRTNEGIYTILTRTNDVKELYFTPKTFSNNLNMYLIRSNLSKTNATILTPKNISNRVKIPNIIIYPNNSLDFIAINISDTNILPSKKDSFFEDIDSETPSKDSLVVKDSKLNWDNISIDDDYDLYIQNKKYGIILFTGTTVNEIMKYSYLTGKDINKSDLIFDYKIVKPVSGSGTSFFANKSSGNKYIKNCYGIFKSADGGINRKYADESAFHDGDIGDMIYDRHHNCVYFCTYRNKTIFML